MSVPVSKRIRDQIKTRLADATYGFNPTYDANSQIYGVTPYTVDFNDPASKTFFLGQIDYNQLILTSPVKTSSQGVLMLYTTRVQDTHVQKFQRFSGVVDAALDVYYSHKRSSALQDFESTGDCLEDTVLDILNRQANQNWDYATVWNGNVQFLRYPVRQAGESWLQPFRFQMQFEVHEQ